MSKQLTIDGFIEAKKALDRDTSPFPRYFYFNNSWHKTFENGDVVRGYFADGNWVDEVVGLSDE